MSEELEALRATVMSSLYKCAENSALYLSEERMEALNKLRSHVAAYCVLDAQQKVATDALDKAKRETDCSSANIEDKFKAHLTKMAGQQCDPSAHPYMQQFNEKVSSVLTQQQDNLNESDLAMTESTEQYIDPITKKQIENPVRNKRCGHIYEQQSIMEILKSNKQLKCPVAGCGDKNHITQADLIFDEEVRLRMTLTQQSNKMQDHSLIDLNSTL